jgi:hypothetical protein
MRNMPGKGNTITYQSRPMRNWWEIIGDIGAAFRRGSQLTVP